MKKLVRALAAAGCLGGVLLTTSCATVSTAPDQFGLLYHSGGYDAKTFDKCVKPSTYARGDWIGGESFVYPARQITYDFNSDGGDNVERGDISVVTSDEVTVGLRGLLTSSLNTDCKTLQKFHELIGLKYGASADGVRDWKGLLNAYQGTPLQDALKRAARNFTWRDLYTNDAKKREFIDAVRKELPDSVSGLSGGDYFSSTYTLQIPTVIPPKGLLDQIQEQKVQVERLATLDSQAAANQKEAEQIQRMVGILGAENYNVWKNMQNCGDGNDQTPCIPFLPVPAGGSVLVQPPH